MTWTLFGLSAGIALTLTTFTGPDPRDQTTNKPSAEQCAAAARDGRTLPGCRGEDGRDGNQAGGQTEGNGPRDQFMVCPGHPRCPR